MSVKSRTKRKIKRAAEKRARKDIMRRQYQEWAKEGRNSKSVRARRNIKKNKLINPFSHQNGAGGACGNIGCKRCKGATV